MPSNNIKTLSLLLALVFVGFSFLKISLSKAADVEEITANPTGQLIMITTDSLFYVLFLEKNGLLQININEDEGRFYYVSSNTDMSKSELTYPFYAKYSYKPKGKEDKIYYIYIERKSKYSALYVTKIIRKDYMNNAEITISVPDKNKQFEANRLYQRKKNGRGIERIEGE